MTTLGKTLVYVNLVLSLVMATFALGVMTNRVPWVEMPPKESDSIIKQREGEVKQLQDVYTRATQRWQQERKDLPDVQAKQKENQAWYDQQLQALVNGPAAPINLLVFQNGKLQLTQKGLPALAPAQNPQWQPIRVMDQLTEATDKQIAQAFKDTQGYIRQEGELSLVLNGQIGGARGLRALLEEAQTAEKNAAAELVHVKELRINGREQAGSLVHRQRQLRARLEVLKKVGVTAQLP
jgi:hypothetical protein